ncbi:MAG: hypothetical protein K2J67_05985 [Lachnospiraceae bacterium]|nr:hypothetical protein [Lachnospiraceae bacterium]
MSKTLNPEIAKELATIRERIETAKKDLSDFIDMKDETISARADDLENAACEQSINVESRFADIEVALCDLSEILISE